MKLINRIRNSAVKEVIKFYHITDYNLNLVNSKRFYEVTFYILDNSNSIKEIQSNIDTVMTYVDGLDDYEHWSKPNIFQKCANIFQGQEYYHYQHSELKMILNKICIGIYKAWNGDKDE